MGNNRILDHNQCKCSLTRPSKIKHQRIQEFRIVLKWRKFSNNIWFKNRIINKMIKNLL